MLLMMCSFTIGLALSKGVAMQISTLGIQPVTSIQPMNKQSNNNKNNNDNNKDKKETKS